MHWVLDNAVIVVQLLLSPVVLVQEHRQATSKSKQRK
jgi:hypothetical protein